MRAAGQLVAGRMQPASLTCLLYTLWIKPLRSPSMTVLTARSSHFPPSISLDPPESPCMETDDAAAWTLTFCL